MRQITKFAVLFAMMLASFLKSALMRNGSAGWEG
jgi:hypothetical protein